MLQRIRRTVSKIICWSMFIAALFITAKKWGEKKTAGFIHGWMEKQHMLCLYNGIVVHEKEWSPDTGYNMDTLENILLSERGQATKATYCVMPCMWNIQNRKIWRDWKTVLARGWWGRMERDCQRVQGFFLGWWIPKCGDGCTTPWI